MKRKRNSGFTVIEMLVTIAIVATLLVVSISIGRSALQRANFTSVLNQFVADVAYTRQLASRLNRYVAIDFDNSGRFYTIKIQENIGNYDDFSDEKKVDPLNGQEFFTNATDFSVNSMGVIRPFPVTANSSPLTVTVEFFQKNRNIDKQTDYKRTVTIFSSGGIKVDD